MTPFNVYRSILPGFSNGKSAVGPNDGARLPSDEAIAARAFERFVARGGEHGFDREDWIDARRDLMTEALAVSRRHDGPADA